MTDAELIAELRRLNEARTPGEWKYGPNWVAAPDPKGAWGGTHLADYCSERDAAFIATAANHMDALLSLAESALTARAEALREAAEIARELSKQDDLGEWHRAADVERAILARIQPEPVGAMERANKAGVAAALAVAALGRSYDTREELERAHLPITRAAVLAFLDEGDAALSRAETDKTYIPGVWRCAKCNFRLVQSTLNARDGTVTARDEPGEPCPNCKSPLWRVSWKDEAQENLALAENQLERALRADAQRDALAKALTHAGETFRHYERVHRAKGTEDGRTKADANAGLAEECERALAAAADIQDDKGEST